MRGTRFQVATARGGVTTRRTRLGLVMTKMSATKDPPCHAPIATTGLPSGALSTHVPWPTSTLSTLSPVLKRTRQPPSTGSITTGVPCGRADAPADASMTAAADRPGPESPVTRGRDSCRIRSASSWSPWGLPAPPTPGSRQSHTASRGTCRSAVAAVIATVRSCSGMTMQYCPMAPSARYPCRDIQKWYPYPCSQSAVRPPPSDCTVATWRLVASSSHSRATSCRPRQRPWRSSNSPNAATASVVRCRPWNPNVAPLATRSHSAHSTPIGLNRRSSSSCGTLCPVTRSTIRASTKLVGLLYACRVPAVSSAGTRKKPLTKSAGSRAQASARVSVR